VRSLALPHRAGAGHGVTWRGEVMGAGARRAREYSAEIRLKASQTRGLLLPFIFATSPYLIRFDRDRASQLRDAVTLGMSFLYIRAPAKKIAKKNQQPQKHQHI
jgi:hypothetical protein